MAVSRHVNEDLAVTPSEHQEAIELFGRVLHLEPQLRAPILDQACAGRPKLRHEVESLLVAYQEAGAFIDTPLIEHALSPEESRTAGAMASPLIPFGAPLPSQRSYSWPSAQMML